MVFGEDSLANGDDLLEQRDSLFDLAVGSVGYCERVLRCEPVRVVFGEGFGLNGDDLLEQRDSLFYLAVGSVGYCERVLRCEPYRVVLGEMTIHPLASLFQTPSSFLDPSIHYQTPSNPEQQIGLLYYINLVAVLQYAESMRKVLSPHVAIRIDSSYRTLPPWKSVSPILTKSVTATARRLEVAWRCRACLRRMAWPPTDRRSCGSPCLDFPRVQLPS